MPKSNGTIFINYRKDDSNWNALALYNELLKYFDESRIFKDFNAIKPGDDFVLSIEKALSKCDVLLVVIGRYWLNATNSNNERRLNDPDDFVRVEIATALERGIQVIPVLFDNTPIPQPKDLPDNLKGLSRRQAIEINPKGFEDDVRRLVTSIKQVLHENDPAPTTTVRNTAYNDPSPVSYSTSAKPDNYLVWAIISTLLCCLPLGIVSIVHASKVDNLYNSGQHQLAKEESAKAKQWAIYAALAGVVVYILYFILLAMGNSYSTNY